MTLADGRVLIQGGTKAYPSGGGTGTAEYAGLRSSYVFDPATNRFTKVDDANEGHWYPTLTMLGTGDVWMAGGLKEDTTGAVNTEMWCNLQQRWYRTDEVPQTWSFWGLYPHMFQLNDGRLFYSGAHVFGDGVPGTGASIYQWQTAPHRRRARPAPEGPPRPGGVGAAAACAGPEGADRRRRQHQHEHRRDQAGRHHRPEGPVPGLPADRRPARPREDVRERGDPARPHGAHRPRGPSQPGRQGADRRHLPPGHRDVADDPGRPGAPAVPLDDGAARPTGGWRRSAPTRPTTRSSCGSRSTSRPTCSAAVVRP